MRLRKIALALFASMALAAFAANVAQAGQWTLGTTENQTTAGTKIASESVTSKLHGTTTWTVTFPFLGTSVDFTATGLHCFLCSIDTTAGVVHVKGFFLMTGASVMSPAHCTLGNGSQEVTSEELTAEVIMDPTSGSTTVFEKFFPESGAFFNLTFGGAECLLNTGEPIQVKGTACGESVHTNAGGTGFEPNTTGTLTKVQTLVFGSSQQTTGGCELKVGKEKAQFTGAIDTELSGANAGKPFGAD